MQKRISANGNSSNGNSSETKVGKYIAVSAQSMVDFLKSTKRDETVLNFMGKDYAFGKYVNPDASKTPGGWYCIGAVKADGTIDEKLGSQITKGSFIHSGAIVLPRSKVDGGYVGDGMVVYMDQSILAGCVATGSYPLRLDP